MLIDPKVTKLVIFNSGGGIVEREMKLSLNQGINEFQIQNVPASFDPNSAAVLLEYIKPEDKNFISLQQTVVSLPDKTHVDQVINREKSAANNIISYSIDFTRELREKISNICEASSYRIYDDMMGIFNFIISSKKEGEIIVKILYFINDIRVKWDVNLKIDIDNDGKSGEIEGFIIVDNQSGFSYDNVELGFAIFELPPSPGHPIDLHQPYSVPSTTESVQGLRDEMFGELNRLKPMKKTQRFKQLK